MKNTICWTDIPVVNLDRAVAFYSALVATPVAKILGTAGGPDIGLLPGADAGASACLYVDPDNAPSAKGPLVYLSVEGRLDSAIRVAAKKGGQLLKKKHQIGPHGYRALIIDSEGNRLALHSMKA